MNTNTRRFLLLISFIFLILLFCTSPNNPFHDTSNVDLKIEVPKKPDGFNYCVNDKICFNVTVVFPQLVKAVTVHFGENGDKEEKEITTNESKNEKIFFEYEYKEKGLKNVKFTVTFRESGVEKFFPCDTTIDIGVRPTIRNEKTCLWLVTS